MRAHARRQILPGALILVSAAMLVLGLRYSASGAGCGVRAAGPGCADAGAPDSAGVPWASYQQSPMSSLSVNAGPPPADGLAALRLSILAGAGLPQRSPRPAAGLVSLRWPVSGLITQLFGVPELGVGLPHTGVDIGLEPGSPVRASQSGRVVFAGGDPCCGLGYWVEINHGDRYSTRYGHLMRPPVVLEGDFVGQGQVIGFSGNTGFSTGPHVHFEVRYDGVPVDPVRVLSPH